MNILDITGYGMLLDNQRLKLNYKPLPQTSHKQFDIFNTICDNNLIIQTVIIRLIDMNLKFFLISEHTEKKHACQLIFREKKLLVLFKKTTKNDWGI